MCKESLPTTIANNYCQQLMPTSIANNFCQQLLPTAMSYTALHAKRYVRTNSRKLSDECFDGSINFRGLGTISVHKEISELFLVSGTTLLRTQGFQIIVRCFGMLLCPGGFPDQCSMLAKIFMHTGIAQLVFVAGEALWCTGGFPNHVLDVREPFYA